MKLSNEILDSIAGTLDARQEHNGTETICYIGQGTGQPSIVLTFNALTDGTTMLSAQTIHGYFELHGLTRFVPVEPGEIIFVSETADRISGLVVGSTGTCSLFANVERSTLGADFALLEPSLLLAAMQLGLAENVTA